MCSIFALGIIENMRAKTYILAFVAAMSASLSCNLFAQEQNQQAPGTDPNLHISVHKQTDANGNVISYDSTYTYIYSGKCCHKSAYVDSIMRKYGMDMNSMFFTMPLNTPDNSNYPFVQQYGVMDFNKMQQMLQNQVNEMMQMYGMPPNNGFFCQPAPSPHCCPGDSVKCHHQGYEKKCDPKENKVKGGVQI